MYNGAMFFMGLKIAEFGKYSMWIPSSNGHPPPSSASPKKVLCMRVGPRALSEKKTREEGVMKRGETDGNAPKVNKLGVNK